MARAAAALLLALACFAGPARALDGASLELGRGNDATDAWRIGLVWNWDKRWWQRGGWHLGAYWEVQLGEWNNGHNTHDLSLTPVFRYQRSAGDVRPYVEAAIGFHLLSDLHISTQRLFSTNFQYGDHFAFGVRTGRSDFSLRLQHVSNGGLAKPNPGINFVLLRYQRHFR
jgi:lipid A 3-O-deacylase